jgi:hypothetical protein
MKSNAIKFNGPPPNAIAMEAIAIYDVVKTQIDASRSELTQLEEEVEDIMSGKPKPKRQKTGKTKKSSDAVRNMASVGGVSVDVGDLSQSMYMGEDSDDSDSFDFLDNL